jgi:hypothetical protein
VKTRPTILLAAALLLLAAAHLDAAHLHPAQAEAPDYIFDTIAIPETDLSSPQVASADSAYSDVTIVSFTQRGVLLMDFIGTQVVPTRALVTGLPDQPADRTPDYWGDPITVGAGSLSRVCWSRDGFTLVATDGLMMQLIQGDHEGVWDLDNAVWMPTGGNLVSLDLWGAPSDAAGPAVFMVWTVCGPMGPYNGDAKCYYASRGAFGWSEPELVAEDLPWAHAEVTWAPGPAGPWPQVFYPARVGDDVVLQHRTRDLASGWLSPVNVTPGGELFTCFQGPFAVVRSWTLDWCILGLGPQPTCPCGEILYLHADDGDWQACNDWTVNYGHFDWPMNPLLDLGKDNQRHAFWYQLDSSSDMIPHRAYLEYRESQGDTWVDAGDFLDAEPSAGLKAQLGMDVNHQGHVVLAWARRDTIEGVEQNQVIRLARQVPPGNPGSALPDPAVSHFRAWPNPFNPLINLEFELADAAAIQLAVYDTRGRLVRQLLNENRPAGLVSTAWNGQDEQGAAVPSGLYFARLQTSRGVTTRKLVLAR